MTQEDPRILTRIGELVDEEHRLRTGGGDNPRDDTGTQRLEAIEVELDQCWDLLNRRRALRDAGVDPDRVSVRDAATVEGYQQ